MAVNYDIPEAVELERMEPVYMANMDPDSFFGNRYFPDEFKNEDLLRWAQKDNTVGLQQVRGYGGKPPRVQHIGDKIYIQKPGVYGEHMILDEEELTRRRNAATTSGGPIPVADMVAECQEILLQRRFSRRKKIVADLLVNGTFSVSTAEGTVVHTDSYTQRTFTASVPWSTHATSTPIADLRSMQLLSRGHSVSFGSDAVFGLNRTWFNHMVANTNTNDLGGRRLQGLTPANSLTAINQILFQEGLPPVEIVEDGYYPDTGSFTLFLPDSVGLLIGKRLSGVKVGAYRYTLNVNNPTAAPNPYMRVIDRGENMVPRTVEIHDGHNGGVVLYFPGSVIKANI